MRKIAIFLFCILLTAMSAVAQGKAPIAGRDATILESNSELSMKGNILTGIYESKIIVYNRNGRDTFGDAPILYNKKEDKLTLIKGGTILPDGKFVPFEEKGINEVTPISLNNSLMYGDFINRVYSFPVADPGCTLYIKYKRVEKADEGYLNGLFTFAGHTATDKTKIVVTLPDSQKLKYHNDGKTEVVKEKGQSQYIFTYGATEKIETEASMLPIQDFSPNLVFSAAENWDSAVKVLKDGIENASTPTPEIEQKAAQLTEKCTSRDSKILAITEFVNSKIQDINLSLGLGGYTPRKAAEILKTGYGDQKDKTTLFIAMLRALKIPAIPALSNLNFAKIYEDVPSIRQFSRVMPAVEKDGRWGVINVVDMRAQTGYVNSRYNMKMLLLGKKAEFVPFMPYFDIPEKTENIITGKIDETGNLSAELTCKISGMYDMLARKALTGLGEEQLKRFYDKAVTSFAPDSRVVSYKNSDPNDFSKSMELNFAVETKDFAVKQDHIMLFAPPPMPLNFSSTQYNVAAKVRKTPYLLGSIKTNMTQYELQLPEGYRPIYIPKSYKAVDPNFGSIEQTFTYDRASNKLTITKILSITRSNLTLERYSDFKKVIDSSREEKNSMILLEKFAK